MASKKQSSSDAWKGWASKDLWSHAEFSEICAGFVPGHPNKTSDELARVNQASENISRGVLAGSLPVVARSDESAASRLYGTHRHYRPAEASAWARNRFEQFPTQLLESVKPAIVGQQEKPLADRERTSLLVIIRALSVMAKADGRGAATAVEKQLQELGFDSPKEKTIRELLKEAGELVAG